MAAINISVCVYAVLRWHRRRRCCLLDFISCIRFRFLFSRASKKWSTLSDALLFREIELIQRALMRMPLPKTEPFVNRQKTFKNQLRKIVIEKRNLTDEFYGIACKEATLQGR